VAPNDLQAPVFYNRVESWDCMLCSYRDSMMGATLEALLRGCKNCVVVTILGVLKVFHMIFIRISAPLEHC
jgi:hypothetical protein